MTAVTCMAGGIAAGAGVALILYILGFCLEVVNCTCQILTCNCEGSEAIPWMWSGEAFFQVLMFCCIGGAIIGLIYGIYKMKEEAAAETVRRDAENAEVARKQRVKWANELKHKALEVDNTCYQNETSDIPLVLTTYKAGIQMAEIMSELARSAEIQGKIDSIADELSKKGGVSG